MTYRVVQWATGNIGTRALQAVLAHPLLELAGVLVYDAAKDGVDAGALCGAPPTGVHATTDAAVVHALGADCVLYMPRALNVNDLVPFLEAGTNVVTTRGEFFDGGAALAGDVRARVLDACTRGGTSVYSTGSSPGFITDALPFALLSMQREVQSIEIDEFANLSKRDSPHLLFELMGFGRPIESFNPRRAEYLLGEFGPALGVLAAAARRPVERWECSGEAAAARRATMIVAGEVPEGSVAAQRITIAGFNNGGTVVRFSAYWYCTDDVEPAWELRATGWRVRVRGDAPFDVDLTFPVPLDDLGAFTPSYTANRPVNAVPYVCDAPAGILATSDLPPIVPAGP